MSKYTTETKLEIVKEIIEKQRGLTETARKYKVHKSDIQKWTSVYREHGIGGLERSRVSYTGEFKQKVVEDMRSNCLSQRETAVKYNLGNHDIVSKWERIYLEEGVEGLYIERRGRNNAESGVQKRKSPKMKKQVEEDLIAENQRLRMENAYLKKLNALVLQKEKSQTERKLR